MAGYSGLLSNCTHSGAQQREDPLRFVWFPIPGWRPQEGHGVDSKALLLFQIRPELNPLQRSGIVFILLEKGNGISFCFPQYVNVLWHEIIFLCQRALDHSWINETTIMVPHSSAGSVPLKDFWPQIWGGGKIGGGLKVGMILMHIRRWSTVVDLGFCHPWATPANATPCTLQKQHLQSCSQCQLDPVCPI